MRSDVDLIARMDDGTEHHIVVDQRDFAAWEAQPLFDPDNSRGHTRMRFLVWNAMRRQQLTTVLWPEFNTRALVDVDAVEPDPEPTAPPIVELPDVPGAYPVEPTTYGQSTWT